MVDTYETKRRVDGRVAPIFIADNLGEIHMKRENIKEIEEEQWGNQESIKSPKWTRKNEISKKGFICDIYITEGFEEEYRMVSYLVLSMVNLMGKK